MTSSHVRTAFAALVAVVCFMTSSPIGAADTGVLPPEQVARIVEDQGGGLRLEGDGIELAVEIRHVPGAQQLVVGILSGETQVMALVRFGGRLAFSTHDGEMQGIVSVSDDGEIAAAQSITYREGEVVSSRWFRAGGVEQITGSRDRK